VKLLRVIEQREILPVGAVEPRSIDVRFLAATNRELDVEIQRRTFRQDLYFRLAGITLRIPPLRERVGEIAGLAARFLREHRPDLTLSPAALRLLERYHWPGNIRELRHTIERAALLCTGATIEPAHLPLDRMADGEAATALEVLPEPEPEPRAPLAANPAPASVADLSTEIDRLERERILRALDECGGNQTRAAEMLGISRSKLISRLDSYGVPRPRRR
jgi:DNA-binding NtrC family response regulator